MPATWINLIGAGTIGGVVAKLLDYAYKEYYHRSEARKSAKNLVDKHIDPILKSADELVGKIRSLAQSDFRELKRAPTPSVLSFESWLPYLNILYLFAQFWSRVQILRIESIFVNLGSDVRGRQLLDFFRALEAGKTRLVDRSWQRGIGELLIAHDNTGNIYTITYYEFVRQFLASVDIQRWFQSLMSILSAINHTRNKQRLLVYGAIINALIDTLDPDHLVTKQRSGWGNKLTLKSKRALKYRIFKVYLVFVKEPKRYYTTSQRSREPRNGPKI